MKTKFRALASASLFAMSISGAAFAQPASLTPTTPADDRCGDLISLHLDQVEITSAVLQAPNTPVPGARYPSMTGNPGGGAQASGLPEFCRVTGSIHPTTDSDIRFEVWLPKEGWDGRFNGANSGGLAGYINYLDLASAIRAGQVGAGSDTGHAASPIDSGWAKGHPEKVRDYGWRGVHLTTVTAKKLIAAYYGRGPDHSYFIGCSNGGRQALMEASRFPEDYDGIVAGAPARALTSTVTSMINAIQAQMPLGASIRPEQTKLLQSEVIKQCDAIDGQIDGLIADPRMCKLDTRKLACGVSDSPQCFSKPQITALKRIYAGVRDKSGHVVAYGYPPSGGEVGYPLASGGWEGNILSKFQAVAGLSVSGAKTMSEGILTDFPPSPIATDTTFDFNKDTKRLTAALSADIDAQPDLTRFFDRGGKLILWHGWADPLLPPEATVDYYQEAIRESGPKAKDQFRFFMVPGMQHCFGGPGPFAIGQIGAPLPSDKPERSVAAAVQAWAEQGRVPDSIVGRRGIAAMMPNATGPEKQRLICAYPAKAVLRDGEDPDKATSYSCQTEHPNKKSK